LTLHHKFRITHPNEEVAGTAFEIIPKNRSIMKHSNQEQTSKNQGTADQNKKMNKTQQSAGNDSGSGSQSSKGNRQQESDREGDGSNWQKGKQGHRK
jgi:hypothetical protein